MGQRRQARMTGATVWASGWLVGTSLGPGREVQLGLEGEVQKGSGGTGCGHLAAVSRPVFVNKLSRKGKASRSVVFATFRGLPLPARVELPV